jgi:hypothetical protein
MFENMNLQALQMPEVRRRKFQAVFTSASADFALGVEPWTGFQRTRFGAAAAKDSIDLQIMRRPAFGPVFCSMPVMQRDAPGASALRQTKFW